MNQSEQLIAMSKENDSMLDYINESDGVCQRTLKDLGLTWIHLGMPTTVERLAREIKTLRAGSLENEQLKRLVVELLNARESSDFGDKQITELPLTENDKSVLRRVLAASRTVNDGLTNRILADRD